MSSRMYQFSRSDIFSHRFARNTAHGTHNQSLTGSENLKKRISGLKKVFGGQYIA